MKILMRGYSDAFNSLDASHAIGSYMIGGNSGNLIFSASVQRNLLTPMSTVTVRKQGAFVRKAASVNEQFDHLVVPMANAFRSGFAPQLAQLTAMIRDLTIPVTILGVGAQASIDYDWSKLAKIEDGVKAFVSAVLDHGPSIGVRGECTADYLRSLGFSDVEVIGCPSMFYDGPSLAVGPGPDRFDESTKTIMSLTPRVPIPEGWVREHFERHPDSLYVGQDAGDLAMMLGGPPLTGPDSDLPGNLAHPVLKSDKMRVYLHGPTWIEQMREYEFAFGSRIHGNIAPMLAGVPAHVIVHDSRTRELAEYFQIPHTLSRDITLASSAEALFEASDWSPMVNGHAARFAHFVAFLDKHGIDHIHRHPDVEPPFDAAVRAADIGPEVIVRVSSSDPLTLRERISQTATRTQSSLAELQGVVDGLRDEVDVLRKRNSELTAELARKAPLRASTRSRIKRRLTKP